MMFKLKYLIPFAKRAILRRYASTEHSVTPYWVSIVVNDLRWLVRRNETDEAAAFQEESIEGNCDLRKRLRIHS